MPLLLADPFPNKSNTVANDADSKPKSGYPNGTPNILFSEA
jgi:hypothetical protein